MRCPGTLTDTIDVSLPRPRSPATLQLPAFAAITQRIRSHIYRRPEDSPRPRYSMAFFCQANKDVVIQGPQKKYAAISAADYLRQRIDANFAPVGDQPPKFDYVW